MGEKNTTHPLIHRRALSTFLFIAAVGVFFTWFNLLSSVSHPHFIDHSALLNEKFLSVSEHQDTHRRRDENALLSYSSEPPSLLDYNDTNVQDIPICDTSRSLLKVFMYDLPPEFHFGLLDWNSQSDGDVWPDIQTELPRYPGGLNLQHSIEYWLTLDLLSSGFTDRNDPPCNAVRVTDSSEADVIFVPFFSSLSYNRPLKGKTAKSINRNKLLQGKLVQFLRAREEWRRSEGQDHVIVAHHPNSMLYARMRLSSSMFILADFGRYPPAIANVEKDVIAPYRHLVETFVNDSSGFDGRPTLIYFQGAIFRKDGGIIRQKLFNLLRNKPGVHFSSGTTGSKGVHQATEGMRSSKFCLHIAGDTPSSNRLFDAIASHCVPIIISDKIELPYEEVLDYSKFCVFVRSSDAVKKEFVIRLIRGISKREWTKMWERLKEVDGHFEYQFPSEKDDAVQMIWQAIARKKPSVQRKLHRLRRFSPSNVG